MRSCSPVSAELDTRTDVRITVGEAVQGVFARTKEKGCPNMEVAKIQSFSSSGPCVHGQRRRLTLSSTSIEERYPSYGSLLECRMWQLTSPVSLLSTAHNSHQPLTREQDYWRSRLISLGGHLVPVGIPLTCYWRLR